MVSPATTVHDETCPLLSHTIVEAQPAQQQSPTPLPVGQLATLCTVRLVDPVAFTQLFPYVNQFMNDLHVTDDPSRIGFYSGLVESTFGLSQLLFICLWAKLSDIIGRRPIIITGILGIAITTVAFGTSKSLAAALIARSLGGMFSGNIAVIHSALGEITDSTNQALAVPLYGVMWPIGSIVGPLIGGTFSNPATKYPTLFDHAIFREYPYVLPCLMSAAIAVVAAVCGFVFLEETLPSKRKRSVETYGSMGVKGRASPDNQAPAEQERSLGIRQLLGLPVMSALVTSGFALSFIATSFDVTFVLFCYTPVEFGGLSFSASQIGWSLATSGFIAAVIQIFVMPHLLRRFDCAKMYIFSMSIWPFAYTLLPFLNIIARGGMGEDGVENTTTTATLWIGIAIVLGITRVGVIAYGLSLILIKEHTPSPASLGLANGIVQFSMCSARSCAPFLASSLFVVSNEGNLLAGYLWVVVMVLIALLGIFESRKISLQLKK